MSFNPFAGGGGGGLPADVKFAVNLTITSEGYTYTFQLYDQNGDAIGDAVELIFPEPMIFKGTVGTAGTISTLPTDGSAVVGWTYKVIEAGTYDGQAAKIGDTFICLSQTDDSNTWVYIPSGDEPSGTVTNVAVGAGLVTGDGNPITSSGTIKVKIQSETKLGGTAATVAPSSFNTNIWPVLLDQSGNLAVKINKTDIGLNNVTNDAQVKKIVSSTNGNIMTWSGSTGDTPADSGVSIETTFSSTSDAKIPTSKSVAIEIAKKQNTINSQNKLDADSVDDTNSTNKFNMQADWSQSSSSAGDYIKNKPTLGTASALNVAASGDASTTEVVKGDDTRVLAVPAQQNAVADGGNGYLLVNGIRLYVNPSGTLPTGDIPDGSYGLF